MTAGTGPAAGCDGHAGLPTEIRAVVLGALDRLTPVLERMQADQAGAPGDSDGPGATRARGARGTAAETPCAVCPVCAMIAAWRGERSELAARAVDHATTLVAVLRAALDEDEGGGADPSDVAAPPDPPDPPDRNVVRHGSFRARPVQHIGVQYIGVHR